MRFHIGAFLAVAAVGGQALSTANGTASSVSLDKEPKPPPNYMVDNQHNWFKSAPDKGSQNGPVWLESGTLDNYTANGGHDFQNTTSKIFNGTISKYGNRTAPNFGKMAAASSYWLPQLASKGKQPYIKNNKGDYKVFRNVVDDYHADNTGEKDATEAINAAILDGNRCGEECGNTFSQGAIVYFPAGTYKICRPIVQLYLTQFIGDPNNRPIIKGCDTFQGIALIDTDPYIPGGNGQNWYINQNQFFRQIRNFVFDMTDMPLSTADKDQALVPTGIHWQVSQACSLQNLLFKMPTGDTVTHVGIFMENGSGGFVSDLEFEGGSIGWRAGSQQYTAMNLKFTHCVTAVQMVWDWGFNWQRISIDQSYIGFNISGRGGDTGQGIGSVSIIDSTISNTPIAIMTGSKGSGNNGAPQIVLDNLQLKNVGTVVKDEAGNVLLPGAPRVDHWAFGKRYNGTKVEQNVGDIEGVPVLAQGLLDGDDKLFYRARPQYENASVDQFLVATDEGCSNDGTGDNAAAINKFLEKAKSQGKIAFFPAGVYRVGSTVTIPTGSIVQGSLWPQIQGAGMFFSNMQDPQVVVKVGERGDVGTVEVVEMIFSVQGATAGAIVLEWNIHEKTQGSAAMWDSHVRVGGATGSNLDFAECPRLEYNENCICASLLFHLTAKASGYFENMWVWLADHDNDMSTYDNPDPAGNQISLYAARGALIESRGPSWFYCTGSEHAVLYQYQLYKAKDVYLGHIQSETPYYQPDPLPPHPFDVAKPFPGDPDFSTCKSDECKAAWGLRIVDSEGITIHGAGLYSFFQNYKQFCVPDHNCQERICEVKGSKDIILYNVFTVGSIDTVSGINNGSIPQNDTQSGFSTEISVWRPLDGDDETNVVYVNESVWQGGHVQCSLPCTLVWPTSTLPVPLTIPDRSYTLPVIWGTEVPQTLPNGAVVTTFNRTSGYVTIPAPQTVVPAMSFGNEILPAGGQVPPRVSPRRSIDMGNVTVPVPDATGGHTPRVMSLPPWPLSTFPAGPGEDGGGPSKTQPGVFHTPFVTTLTATGATVLTLSFPTTVSPVTFKCPPSDTVEFSTPAATITPICDGTSTVYGFTCPATKLVTFLGAAVTPYTVDCTLSTSIPTARPPTTTKDPSTTPPPVWTDWPGGSIQPITTDVSSTTHYGGLVIVPCSMWFFNFCPPGTKGWKFPLPTGIIGPGPPPPRFVDGWSVEGHIPDWPVITVHPGPELEVEKKPDPCKEETATAYRTTVVTTTSIDKVGSTHISTSTASQSQKIYGCSIMDKSTTSTSATTTSACPKPTNNAARHVGDTFVEPRADVPSPLPPPGCPQDAMVFLYDIYNFGNVASLLNQKYANKFKKIGGLDVKKTEYVLYFYVSYLDTETLQKLKDLPEVIEAYYAADRLEKYGGVKADKVALHRLEYNENADEQHAGPYSEPLNTKLPAHPSVSMISNETDGPHKKQHQLRDEGGTLEVSAYWSASLVSHPPTSKGIWPSPYDYDRTTKTYRFNYHSAAGAGQHVYIIYELDVWTDHSEFKGKTVSEMSPGTKLPHYIHTGTFEREHGTMVTCKVVGIELGVCQQCAVTVVVPDKTPPGYVTYGTDMIMMFNDVYQDIVAKGRNGKAVINLSAGAYGAFGDGWQNALSSIMVLLNQTDIPIVVASGNDAKDGFPEPHRVPQVWGDPSTKEGAKLPNLMVVGAGNRFGRRAEISQYAEWLTTHADGDHTFVATDIDKNNKDNVIQDSGTSFAAPQVAGLIAYYRSLPSKWAEELKKPANVKKMIKIFHRYIFPRSPGEKVKMIWNGQIGAFSCIVDYDTRFEWQDGGLCPDMPERGEFVNFKCNMSPKRRDTGHLYDGSGSPTCPISMGGNGINFNDAPKADPVCPPGKDCGGRLCTGYSCDPNAHGPPPGTLDPKDPDNTASRGDGDAKRTCQIDAGCQTFTCPPGQSGRCRQGYCACEQGNPPDGRACQTLQQCQGFPCDEGKTLSCDQGYCTCKATSCTSGSCDGVQCPWDKRPYCQGGECACINDNWQFKRTIKKRTFDGTGSSYGTLVHQDASHQKWNVPYAEDGCTEKPEPQSDFKSWCVDEANNRVSFQLNGDVPRCLKGGALGPKYTCPGESGWVCQTADFNSVECTW